MGKTWSRGTNSRLPFGVNVNLNLSNSGSPGPGVEDGQVISRLSSPADLGWHAKVPKFPIACGLLIPPITEKSTPGRGGAYRGWGGVAGKGA